jgi:hypothetical protein
MSSTLILSLVLFPFLLAQSHLAQEPAATPPPGLTAEQKKLITAADDAVREARQAVLQAENKRTEAASHSRQINNLTALKTADDAALRSVEELIDVTEGVAAADFLVAEPDNTVLKRLNAAKTQVTDAQTALPTGQDQPAEIQTARANCAAAIERLDAAKTSVTEAQTQLKTAVGKIYSFVGNLADRLTKRVAPLSALAANAEAGKLRRVLPTELPNFQQAERLTRELAGTWEELAAKLQTVENSGQTEQEPAVTQKIVAARQSVRDTVGRLGSSPGWLVTLRSESDKEVTRVRAKRDEVRTDPVANSSGAVVVVREDQPLLDDISSIHSAAVPLLTLLAQTTDLEFDSTAISGLVEQLNAGRVQLKGALADLQDALGGNAENFQADQVSLFYFTDVPRLMQVLNPATQEIGGIGGLRARAEDARRSLNAADVKVADAQVEVNTLQRRLEQLREELRLSRAQLLSADNLLLSQTRRLEELRSRPNPDSGRITRETHRQEDLQRDRDAANENANALQDEQNGLPAQIRDAQARLTEAQQEVRRRRTDALLLAQTESDLFAQVRDNTPFFYAPAVGTSTDPARRVLMYAFGDSKTVFLRGNSEDLDMVKTMIAIFDRPAPQARMSLWALELNSTADESGTKRFNKALETIENELASTRARIAGSVSFLRDCINAEVNRVAMDKLLKLDHLADSSQLRWARMHVYQREVLIRLGFDPNAGIPTGSRLGVTRFTLADPAGTTTLGEALMVLTLANPDSRRRIIQAYTSGLRTRLDALGVPALPQNRRSGSPQGYPTQSLQWFALTQRAMGNDLEPASQYPGLPTLYALSSSQQELVRAITRAALPRALEQLRVAAQSYELLEQQMNATSVARDKNRIEAQRENLVDNDIKPILEWLWREFQIVPSAALGSSPSASVMTAVIREARSAAAMSLDPLRTANARVAAADQMLKEIIIAFEDDLDLHFIQPMLSRVRNKLIEEKGIGVGVIQRTSVLATNRLQARVDARGSAQLAVGDTQNILAAFQQLGQLIASGQAGGPLGILSGLNRLPQGDTTELYGLTTNGTFQVTPIFDPSGQALRFKLDQVFANVIREPDGTVNPQLARIERHTVNTEVQLSNLELREVSRFNSNSRLGLPVRKFGGIPILNNIPYVREVPLIGWFVRKSGKSAVTQQSLIFGQTTIYPTIGDILDLLKPEDHFRLQLENGNQ